MSTRSRTSPNIALLPSWLLMALLAMPGCAPRQGSTLPQSAAVSRDSSFIPSSPRERKLMDQHFLQGSILQMQERYADAIAQYNAALRIAPRHPAAHYAMARCYNALGRPDTALTHAEQALALTPDNLDARMQLAELLLANGRLTRAVEQYEEVVRREPTNAQARYNAARLLQRIDPTRAIQHYEYIRKYLAEDYSALLNLAELYMNQRNYDGVIDVLRELLAIDTDDSDLYRLLSDAYQLAGRYDEAIKLLAEVEEHVVPDSAVEEFMVEEVSRTARGLGIVEVDSRYGEYARTLAVIVTERVPKRWETAFYSGMIFYHLDDRPHADSLFHRALEHREAPARAWTDAASIYIEDGLGEHALRFLAPTAHRYRDDYRVLHLLGYAYLTANMNDSAERYLKRSLAIEEQNGAAWGQLAELYGAQGKTAASENAYERAVEYDPEDPTILNNFAYFLAGRGRRLDYALTLIDRALQRESENEAFLDTKGWIYYKLADYKRALQYIQRSVDIGGASVEVLEHLGDTQSALGNLPAAREAYKRALKLDPENEGIRKKLGEIDSK